jgi:hypothetical protein
MGEGRWGEGLTAEDMKSSAQLHPGLIPALGVFLILSSRNPRERLSWRNAKNAAR